MTASDKTLAELRDELDAYDAEVARRVELDRRRTEYLDRLLAAVGGDKSATWAVAHRAAFGENI